MLANTKQGLWGMAHRWGRAYRGMQKHAVLSTNTWEPGGATTCGRATGRSWGKQHQADNCRQSHHTLAGTHSHCPHATKLKQLRKEVG
mgnify:CR=1 FL=1